MLQSVRMFYRIQLTRPGAEVSDKALEHIAIEHLSSAYPR